MTNMVLAFIHTLRWIEGEDRNSVFPKAAISVPLISIAPAVGSSNRNTVLPTVDLPQPLSPTSP